MSWSDVVGVIGAAAAVISMSIMLNGVSDEDWRKAKRRFHAVSPVLWGVVSVAVCAWWLSSPAPVSRAEVLFVVLLPSLLFLRLISSILRAFRDVMSDSKKTETDSNKTDKDV